MSTELSKREAAVATVPRSLLLRQRSKYLSTSTGVNSAPAQTQPGHTSVVQSWVSRARQLKAYAPAVVFWFTILQLVVAPFKFDIGMPAPMRVALDSLASVLYVEVQLPGPTNVAALLIIIALLMADLALVLVPVQHLHLVLGGPVVLAMHAGMVAKQSLFMIPIIKFLFSSWVCSGGSTPFLGGPCGSGAHVGVALAAAFSAAGMLGVGIAYERSQHSITARARLGHIIPFVKDRNIWFASSMMGLKVCMALVLGVARSAFTPATNVALLLLFSLFATALVAWTTPFFSTQWTGLVLGALVGVVWTNVLTLASTITPPSSAAAFILGTAWAATLLPSMALARWAFLKLHTGGIADEVWDQMQTPAHLHKPAGGVAGPTAGRLVSLRHTLLDLPPGTWTALFRVMSAVHPEPLRVAPCVGTYLDLASNQLSGSNMQLLLSALATNPSYEVYGIDLSGNKDIFPSGSHNAPEQGCFAKPLHTRRSPRHPLCGLGAFLMQYPALQRLCLAHIPLSPGVLDTLVNTLISSRVTRLDLSHCALGPAHAQCLARLLSDSTSLTHLNLSGNGRLQAASATVLATGITACSGRGQLVHLDVSWCGLGLTGATTLMHAVCPTARDMALHLHCNGIPFDTYAELKARLGGLLSAGLPSSASLAAGAAVNEAELGAVLEGKSIYEAIGGGAAVEAVVGTFYVYLVSHPATAPFFRHVAMGRMRHLQGAFISSILGSTGTAYRGKDMAAGHAHLGITDDVFDQTVALLVDAVLHHHPDAPRPILHKLLGVVETLREPVVDPATRHALPEVLTGTDAALLTDLGVGDLAGSFSSAGSVVGGTASDAADLRRGAHGTGSRASSASASEVK